MIGLFRKKYPEVAIQLQIHSTRRTCWAVANGQVDLAIIGGSVPPELQDSLEVIPYAEDEMALILAVNHPLAELQEIDKEELYQLRFITLDSQSTIRKVIDNVLIRWNVDPKRLKVEMELNSIEAIKNAVQSGLGAAFVSVKSIEKELKLGILHQSHIKGVELKRTLSLIINPNRYRSKASEAFSRDVLPEFTTLNEYENLEKFYQKTNNINPIIETNSVENYQQDVRNVSKANIASVSKSSEKK